MEGIKFNLVEDQIEIEWDKDHPVWSKLNNMTKEEVEKFVIEAIKKGIDSESCCGNKCSRHKSRQ